VASRPRTQPGAPAGVRRAVTALTRGLLLPDTDLTALWWDAPAAGWRHRAMGKASAATELLTRAVTKQADDGRATSAVMFAPWSGDGSGGAKTTAARLTVHDAGHPALPRVAYNLRMLLGRAGLTPVLYAGPPAGGDVAAESGEHVVLGLSRVPVGEERSRLLWDVLGQALHAVPSGGDPDVLEFTIDGLACELDLNGWSDDCGLRGDTGGRPTAVFPLPPLGLEGNGTPVGWNAGKASDGTYTATCENVTEILEQLLRERDGTAS